MTLRVTRARERAGDAARVTAPAQLARAARSSRRRTLTTRGEGRRRRRVPAPLGAGRGRATSRRTATATGTSRSATPRRSSRCVVWSRDVRRIPAPPDDGMQVMALRPAVRVRGARPDAVHGPRAGGRGRGTLAQGVREDEGARSRRTACSTPRASARCRASRGASPSSRAPTAPRCTTSSSVIRRRNPGVEIVRRARRACRARRAPESLVAALARVARWRRARTS